MGEVRVLNVDDAVAFREVRLRALKEHPEAFGSSYEEEQGLEVEEMAGWLTTTSDSIMFGAYEGEALVGTLGLRRFGRMKSSHRASLGVMYVAPEARGKGMGKALVEAAMTKAKAMEGLEDVVLAVTVGNDSARRLYLKAGFQPYGIDPRYLHVGEQYFDIEWMILRIQHDG